MSFLWTLIFCWKCSQVLHDSSSSEGLISILRSFPLSLCKLLQDEVRLGHCFWDKKYPHGLRKSNLPVHIYINMRTAHALRSVHVCTSMRMSCVLRSVHMCTNMRLSCSLRTMHVCINMRMACVLRSVAEETFCTLKHNNPCKQVQKWLSAVHKRLMQKQHQTKSIKALRSLATEVCDMIDTVT